MKENNTYNEELGGRNLPDSLRVNPFLTPKNFFDEQQEQIFKQTQFDKILRIENFTDNRVESDLNIPDGYFENLADSIFSKISEQNLQDKVKDDGFSTPDTYFEQLPLGIDAQIFAEDLKSTVPTLDFKVADDYFETAENQILGRIAEETLITQVGKESCFAVPTNYFEEAENNIEATLLSEKWKSEIDNNEFNVPAGYFDKLTTDILSKTSDTTKQETKIITIPRRTNWQKYSAAAAVIMILGIGSYFGLQNINFSSNSLVASEVNLEDVSDEEIISYLAQVSDGADLIHLAEFASEPKEETTQLDSDIDSEVIEEYLNYML